MNEEATVWLSTMALKHALNEMDENEHSRAMDPAVFWGQGKVLFSLTTTLKYTPPEGSRSLFSWWICEWHAFPAGQVTGWLLG